MKRALVIVGFAGGLLVVALLGFGLFSAFAQSGGASNSQSGGSADSATANVDGAAVYAQNCQSCHQSSGGGVVGTFPPLAGNDALTNTDFVISVVLNGLDGDEIVVNGTTYSGTMPAWKDKLSTAEVAAVLTHERTSWGNDFGAVSEEQVKQVAASGKTPQALMPASQKPSAGSTGNSSADTSGFNGSNSSTSGSQSGSASLQVGYETSMTGDDLKNLLKNIRYVSPSPKDVMNLEGPFGEAVINGYRIFTDTQTYAPEYVGNGLDCSNCHLNAGTLPYAAPLWGAFPNFPTYRTKNHRINIFEKRVQGCFIYSENGTAPPPESRVLDALSAYAFWLSQGLPVGLSVPGRGYGQEKMEKLEPDKDRGGELYAEKCAICHGENGQGTLAKGTEGYQFPPLWGSNSFNWGAGMHSQDNFAGFIKHNMPLGQGGSLSDQEAWDIAAWVTQDSHQRPVPGE